MDTYHCLKSTVICVDKLTLINNLSYCGLDFLRYENENEFNEFQFLSVFFLTEILILMRVNKVKINKIVFRVLSLLVRKPKNGPK